MLRLHVEEYLTLQSVVCMNNIIHRGGHWKSVCSSTLLRLHETFGKQQIKSLVCYLLLIDLCSQVNKLLLSCSPVAQFSFAEILNLTYFIIRVLRAGSTVLLAGLFTHPDDESFVEPTFLSSFRVLYTNWSVFHNQLIKM